MLQSAISRENVLPNAMIRDILVANPHSATSDKVMAELTNRFVPMADSMIAEILEGVGKAVIGLDRKIASLAKISSTIYFYKINDSLEFDSLYTMPRTYDSLCPYPIISDTVDPDCGLIVSIQDPEVEPEAYRLKIYPNPASGKLTIEIPEFLEKQTGPADFQVSTVYHQWGSATLEAWDLFGKKLLERQVTQGSAPVELDVNHWPAGMVVFRLMYQGETVATDKVVVR